MAREDFDITVRGNSRKFGLDRVSKKMFVPQEITAHDLISAITLEHDASGLPFEDYPLGLCVHEFVIADGWVMAPGEKARVSRKNFSLEEE